MKRSEFTERVIRALPRYLPPEMAEGIVITRSKVIKNNDQKCKGIVIRRPGSSVCPTFYLDDMYRAIKKGVTSFDTAMTMLAQSYVEALENAPPESEFFQGDVKDYGACAIRLVSEEKNRKYLSEHVNLPIGLGMALTADYVVPDDHGGQWRARITNDLFSSFGMTTEEFFEDIISAISIRNPPVLIPMTSRDDAPDGDRNIYDKENWDDEELVPMYVLTTKDFNFGASVIAYPGVLERISEIVQGDYYLVPSSVHEFMVTPACMDISPVFISEMIGEVNRDIVAGNEYLSDELLIYSREKGELMRWKDTLN